MQRSQSGQAQKTNKTEALKQGRNLRCSSERTQMCLDSSEPRSRCHEGSLKVVLDVEDLKTLESAVGSR